MDSKRTEYEDAFEAWDAATTKYVNAMKAIFDGQPLENFSVDVLIQNMAMCRSRLDLAVKPLRSI
jgi:hypothetical protein